MNANRVFRAIWRVNGVLILLCFVLAAGAALLGAVAALAVGASGAATEPPPPAAVEGKEELRFGEVQEIGGTPYVLLPLETRGGGASSLGSYDGAAETRNLLFYDAGSGKTRFLRPDHRGIVLSHELLHDPRGAPRARFPDVEDPPAPVRWIRYEIVGEDTDGDGELTRDDAAAVVVSGPGGESPVPVVRGADEILGYAPPTPAGALLVFFRRGAEHLVAEIDLDSRKVRRTSALPGR